MKNLCQKKRPIAGLVVRGRLGGSVAGLGGGLEGPRDMIDRLSQAIDEDLRVEVGADAERQRPLGVLVARKPTRFPAEGVSDHAHRVPVFLGQELDGAGALQPKEVDGISRAARRVTEAHRNHPVRVTGRLLHLLFRDHCCSFR